MTQAADPLSQRAQARVGTILNQKYRLDHLLGVGGMAAVYLAVHRNGNRVAVKLLHRDISADPEVRSRFLLEGYAANNLEHPGTVRVLDDDTAEDGSAFLVMELLEGTTIDQRAAAMGGALPHRVVMDAAHALLDVLVAAQQKGIVHRDIKPQNIFVTTEGAIKILDFGLARVQDTRAAHATRAGQVFGTPAFMPPEQALGRTAQIDHRSDLWATGATMFTLMSGKYVHEAETSAEHLVLCASRQARSLAEVAPNVPAPIVAIVDRALRFVKEERWHSAREMQLALEEAYARVYRAPPPPRRGPRPSMVSISGDLDAVRRDRVKVSRRVLLVAAPIAAIAVALAAWAAIDNGAQSVEDPAIPSASTAPPVETAVAVEPAASPSISASAPPTAEAAPTESAPTTSARAPSVTAPRPTRKIPGPHPSAAGSFDHQ